MDEHLFVTKGGAKIGLVSQAVVCRCKDNDGMLLYDFRTKSFIRKGKCKLMLLCTLIQMNRFKTRLAENKFVGLGEVSL